MPLQQFFPHRKNGGGLPEVVISGSPDEPPPEAPEPIMVPFPTEGAPDPYTVIIPPEEPPFPTEGEPPDLPEVVVSASRPDAPNYAPLLEPFEAALPAVVPKPRRVLPRRTQPPPKTRPRRPVKPPFRPRIPIVVPKLVPGATILGRVLGGLAGALLSPAADALSALFYSGPLGPHEPGALDAYYFPFYQPSAQRLPDAPPAAPPTFDIPGVTITAPRPFAPPYPYAPPLASPGVIAPELPAIGIPPVPTALPKAPPVPRAAPVPGLDIPVPPFPLPALAPRAPAPPAPKKPPKQTLGFLHVPGPVPVPEPDPCKQCANKKKDQKKKKPDRNKCFKGIYYERKKGLNKHKQVEIPCR